MLTRKCMCKTHIPPISHTDINVHMDPSGKKVQRQIKVLWRYQGHASQPFKRLICSYSKCSGRNTLSVVMFSKEREWLKNLRLICKNKADLRWLNLLQSQLKALCWCKWNSILPPQGEATRMGTHCLGVASRGPHRSWESCHPQGCLMMPGEWEEDGQQLLLPRRQCTPGHSHWLTHLGPHAWQRAGSSVSVALTQKSRQRNSGGFAATSSLLP